MSSDTHTRTVIAAPPGWYELKMREMAEIAAWRGKLHRQLVEMEQVWHRMHDKACRLGRRFT